MLPMNKSPSSINPKSKSPITNNNNNINSANSNSKINFTYGPE
jgi:hypothetical protein